MIESKIYRTGGLRFFNTVSGRRQTYKQCWKCKYRLRCSSVFCSDSLKDGSCGIIQPVHERAVFTEVFFPDRGQLPMGDQFKVEYDTLRKSYLTLQKKVHPDFWVVKSQELGEMAKEQSSFVNRGFYTLKDPVRRAKYLLSLNGMGPEETKIQNSGFLERIFDLSTRIRSGSDSLAQGARDEAKELETQLIGMLEGYFSSEDLAAAGRCIEMLQYVRRVLQSEEEAGPSREE